MPAPVSIGGGWFDPHNTYASDAITMQEHEQRLAAEEFLTQKLLTVNYRREADMAGELFTHHELVQMMSVCEMSSEEVLAAFVHAIDEYELNLTLELSTHRVVGEGRTIRCREYVAFKRVTS